MRSWTFVFSWVETQRCLLALSILAWGITALAPAPAHAAPQDDTAEDAEAQKESDDQDETATEDSIDWGVSLNTKHAYPGYNLITPEGHTTYLFDNGGRVVNSWTSKYAGHAVEYMLDNGHLFRTGSPENPGPKFRGPAKGGRFQEFDWDGNLVWDYEYKHEKRLPHHDAIRLPNGNALLVCWEWIDAEEAIAQGCDPEAVKDTHVQPDCLVEIKPTGRQSGEVVWEWRSWDHLIQDRDRHKPNYGRIEDHPERFDVNYVRRRGNSTSRNPDWMHVNAVAYNADLDQIALSSPAFCEIWIIDHSTTTEEARGHTGGRWGKGGDILYRWGNPATYRLGTRIDQRLFAQHNIHWIPSGRPGAGHLLVFNNGPGREPAVHSTVDEFEPEIDQAGRYVRREHTAFGPDAPVWSYSAPNKEDFFSSYISGAQRLPNGNTLICSGADGIAFEVTPQKEVVWKFRNPINEPREENDRPRPFRVFRNDVRGTLGMKEEQNKKLDEIDNKLNAKLKEILDADQLRTLSGPIEVDFSSAAAGEYLLILEADQLKLTDSQTAALKEIASEFNPQITSVISKDQKAMIAEFKKTMAPPRRDGPQQPRYPLFRAKRYGVNHIAVRGRTMTPGKTLVEIQQERDQAREAKN